MRRQQGLGPKHYAMKFLEKYITYFKIPFAKAFIFCVSFVLFYSGLSIADGAVIDKIYHPYVQPLEREIEFRALMQDNQPGYDDRVQLYRLAYGQSINEHWFGEIYIIGEQSAHDDFNIEAYELEALWQITEQGEFAVDWGMLFEIEKEAHKDIWELSVGLLAEKEWGKWSSTANVFITEEWGSDIDSELETSLGLQARYRYSKALEPALEFYRGEDTRALGPALLGQIALDGKRQITWEAGVIFGLDEKSPNQTLRLLAEFEF